MHKKKPPPAQPGGGRSSSVSEPDAPERPPKPGAKPKVATPPPHDDDEMDDGTTLYNELTDLAITEESKEPAVYEETAHETRGSTVPEPQEEYTFVEEESESTYEDTSEMEKVMENKRATLPHLPTSPPPKKDQNAKGKTKSDPELPPEVPAHTNEGHEERRRPSAGGVGYGVSMETIGRAMNKLRKVPSIADEPKSPEPEIKPSPFTGLQLRPVNKPQISPKPSVGQTNNDHTKDWTKGLRKSTSQSPPVSPRSPTSGQSFSTADESAAPPPPLPSRPTGKATKATSPVHVAQNGSSGTITRPSHVTQNGSAGNPSVANETQAEEEEEMYADGFSLIEPLSSSSWFHGVLSRDDAEAKLRVVDQDGAYLVRKTDKDMPYKEKDYILSVMTEGTMYNLMLRQKADGKYALGKEKENELAFERVEDLLKFHKTDKLVLLRNGREVLTVLTSYSSAER